MVQLVTLIHTQSISEFMGLSLLINSLVTTREAFKKYTIERPTDLGFNCVLVERLTLVITRVSLHGRINLNF